ncbi:MAG: enoyl-CoA hydratase/isomerase family protein [Candidatus Promineifilaceae bacterium]
MSQLITTIRRGEIFEIILDRADKRNAINGEMYQQLDQAVQAAEQAEGIRVVLIRGEGKVFSAGIDVSAFLELPQRYGGDWIQKSWLITREFQAVLNRLEQLPVPTIALLHGYCLGLAMELSLACDIRIAAEGTKIGLLETRLGIIPDVGGTTRLTRLVGPGRAKEVIFTGGQMDAAQAAEWGIVNHVVPSNQLLEKGEAIAAEIMASAPLAVGMAKKVINGLVDLEKGLTLEGWAQSQLFQTEDFMEAVQSFLMKRPPEFKGK